MSDEDSLKNNFESMTHQLNKRYLEQQGIELIECLKSDLTNESSLNNVNDIMEFENNIMERYNDLSEEYKLKTLVLILDKLGYSQVKNDREIYMNVKILSGIIPNLNIDKIINIYPRNINKQIELLNFIDYTINCIEEEKNVIKEKQKNKRR